MSSILDNIKSTEDLKDMDIKDLNKLSKEIRRFLINTVSNTGGHLSSNLGVVELTLALHHCFDSPDDKFIWDVGHQAYIHKIITGRKEKMNTIRQYKGLSGFPKRSESEHDIFNTGHSSTSISAGLGLVKARELLGENNHVISIIGDGSMTGGMAFEALNNAGRLNSNFIVVLNDNQMSISKNVGGLSKYLDSIRTGPVYNEMKVDIEKALSKIPKIGKDVVKAIRDIKEGIKQVILPGMLFEELGFTYLGPIDGHNISQLIKTFNQAKRLDEPILIHIKTIKGKGFRPAEMNPSAFHGTKPFYKESGKLKCKSKCETYSKVFGETLTEIAKNNKKVVAITAAMPEGTGLNRFSEELPDRFYDVGIAEQHAVTFAAGLATSGFKPVVAIYSSFLQRAYDQIIHDVCMQKLPVVFAIDRAGLVGADGETHQGVYDLSFLNHIPNMSIMAPKNKKEFIDMIKLSVDHNGPIALRYPRGEVSLVLEEHHQSLEYGKSEYITESGEISIIAVGTMVETAIKVAHKLRENNIDSIVVNARFVKPVDTEMIKDISGKCKHIFVIEENSKIGGYGSNVQALVFNNQNTSSKVHCFGIEDKFIEHGKVSELIELCNLDERSIYEAILKIFKGE